MGVVRKNDLRVWGVWDSVISRLEYLSQSSNDCRHVIDLYHKAHREGLELLRFDLSPLYYDQRSQFSLSPVSSVSRFSISATMPDKTKTTQNRKR